MDGGGSLGKFLGLLVPAFTTVNVNQW